MRISTESGMALAFTAAAVTGIVGFKASESKLNQMEPWITGTITLGTAVPGILGAAALSSAFEGNALKASRFGGLLAASAGVGGLLGVAISAATQYDNSNRDA